MTTGILDNDITALGKDTALEREHRRISLELLCAYVRTNPELPKKSEVSFIVRIAREFLEELEHAKTKNLNR